MKKIFLFLAIASTTMFVSCSDDDENSTDPNAATSIVLASNLATIEVGQSVTFTVTDNNALVVTGSSTILANDVAVGSATFTPTVAGAYTIKATHTNTNDVVLESNTITVTVTEPVTVEDNSIFVNGQNYSVTTSALVFFGGYAEDPNATAATHGLWSYIMSDDETGGFIGGPTGINNYIDVEMIVPIVDGSAPFPTPANAAYLDIYEASVNGAEVVFTTQEGGSIVLGAFPAAIEMPHTFSSTTMYNSGSTLMTKFSGNWLGFVDATAGKPAAVAKSAQSFTANLMTKEQVLANKAKFMANFKK